METLDLSQIIKKLKAKEISSLEVTKIYLEKIKKEEPSTNAFITVCEEGAVEEAKKSDERRAKGEAFSDFDGVPYTAKDLYCTKGIRTTAGSRMLENFVPPYDSTVTKKLKDLGCVLLGKTNTDEFAMGSSTENSYFGPTKNPYDEKKVAGGSSGGSAAATAKKEAPFALGTDTGGSIRQPASFCGVVGIKPTYGRVSRYGVVAYGSSLDSMGVFAPNVLDASLVLEQIAGQDEKDGTSHDGAVPTYSQHLSDDIKGKKIGIPKEFFGPGFDERIKENFFKTAEIFRTLGCEVSEISLPLTKYATAAYYIIAKSEASTNLARYDGIRYGHAESGENLSEIYFSTRAKGFGEEVKRSIMTGTYTLSSGYYDAFYKKAVKVRSLIRKEYEDTFRKVDALIAPVSPVLPFSIGEKIDDPLAMYLTDVCTVSANLAGIPGLAVPSGMVENLPVGIQILGKHFDEKGILNLGNHFLLSENLTI